MFEAYQEFKLNFIELFKEHKVNIIKIDNDEIYISVNLMVINDNLIYLTLKKIELSHGDQMSSLSKIQNLKIKKLKI